MSFTRGDLVTAGAVYGMVWSVDGDSLGVLPMNADGGIIFSSGVKSVPRAHATVCGRADEKTVSYVKTRFATRPQNRLKPTESVLRSRWEISKWMYTIAPQGTPIGEGCYWVQAKKN